MSDTPSAPVEFSPGIERFLKMLAEKVRIVKPIVYLDDAIRLTVRDGVASACPICFVAGQGQLAYWGHYADCGLNREEATFIVAAADRSWYAGGASALRARLQTACGLTA